MATLRDLMREERERRRREEAALEPPPVAAQPAAPARPAAAAAAVGGGSPACAPPAAKKRCTAAEREQKRPRQLTADVAAAIEREFEEALSAAAIGVRGAVGASDDVPLGDDDGDGGGAGAAGGGNPANAPPLPIPHTAAPQRRPAPPPSLQTAATDPDELPADFFDEELKDDAPTEALEASFAAFRAEVEALEEVHVVAEEEEYAEAAVMDEAEGEEAEERQALQSRLATLAAIREKLKERETMNDGRGEEAMDERVAEDSSPSAETAGAERSPGGSRAMSALDARDEDALIEEVLYSEAAWRRIT